MIKELLKYKFLLLWIITIQSLAYGQINEAVTFKHYSTASGLSSGVITSIIKDHQGFMWFGTQDGLNKFDGYNFTVYSSFQNQNSDTTVSESEFILCLFEDSNKNLWIGTENNGLSLYNRNTDSFTTFRHNNSRSDSTLPNNTIRSVAEIAGGHLLIGTDQGLALMDTRTFRVSPLSLNHKKYSLYSFSIQAILVDIDQSIWLGTNRGLLHIDQNFKLIEHFEHLENNPASLSNNSITDIKRLSNDVLFVSTLIGLNAFDETVREFTRYYYDLDDRNIENSEIQAIAEDDRGNIWLGSFGGGLITANLENNESSIYMNDPDNPESLSNNYVFSIYFDDSGILWIGTYGGGINQLNLHSNRFTQWKRSSDQSNSIPGNEVYTVLCVDNFIWTGTENGLGIYDKRTRDWQTVSRDENRPDQLNSNIIYSLYQTRLGDLWIGTSSSGLNKLTNDNLQKGNYSFLSFSTEQPGSRKLMSDQIYCISEDASENIWVGTSDGIMVLKDNVVTHFFTNNIATPSLLPDNEIYCLLPDRQNNMWIGTYRGLSLFNQADSSFTPIVNEVLTGSQQPGSVYCLHQSKDGFIWAGTDSYGLLKISTNSGRLIRQYTNADQLPNQVIYGIAEDEQNNLWLSTNNGIVKAIIQKDSDQLSFTHFNSSKGLDVDAFNIGSYATGDDGFIYFGSFEGLTVFHPEDVEGNIAPPPVFLTDFQLFFKAVEISSEGDSPLYSHISQAKQITLNHDQNVLKFGFTALNFIEPEANQFAFMMENLESDWNYVGNQTEAQYLYLPPGNYVFKVKAANNDGVWNNTGTSLQIRIKPPFTQTVWFYFILLAGSTLLIIWIMNFRTKRLKQSRDLLEKEVNERTLELRNSNQNLQEEIKERKIVEEKLKKSEARFRQLIETMNEGFSVQDKNGKINYVNPKLCEMFGFDANEVLGTEPWDYIDDSDPQYIENFHRQREISIQNGEVTSFELKWKRKDGTIFDSMVSPKPIITKDGEYQGSVAVITDITELKNAERELIGKNKQINLALDNLKKAQEQLVESEKMASLGQLTAGVAHEINNPINFVSGNVQPLRRDLEDVLEVLHKYDEIIAHKNLHNDFEEISKLKKEIDFDFLLDEIENLLQGIGEGASRTSEIVKGLKNFSRTDEQELKLADINQGIESTLFILQNKMKDRITVTKKFEKLPQVMCYPGQLNQVFLNILNNAQEAIDGNGEIIITTREESENIYISIKDSGKGIPKSVQKKIFDPFFTTKEIGKGTGLGLSISFGIIEKHKGKIVVLSDVDQGTEFQIILPKNIS